MKPLIERLKEERSEMLELLGKITEKTRMLKVVSETGPDPKRRRQAATDYARAAHTMFRVQTRLGEIKQEIKDENARLHAAVEQINIENRRQRRAGLNSETNTKKASE